MLQSKLVLDKYLEKQSGYFRLTTTVELGVGVTYRKLLFCHGVSEGNMEKKNSTREYNNRTVYECFNNTFPADFGSSSLNIPPINIDDRPRTHKIARYTPDPLPDTISFASEKSFSTLTKPSYLTQLLLLTSDFLYH